MELESNGLDKWAGIFGLNWSVRFGWSWSEMGENVGIELEW